MIQIDLRSLVSKLNDTCRRALEGAAGLCLSKSNYDVEIEHLLLKLIDVPDGDIALICKAWEINPDRVTQELMRSIDRLRTGNSRAPALSPRLPKLFRDAWVLASVQFGAKQVRSGLILLALVADEDSARLLAEISRELRKLSADALAKDLFKVVAGSSEMEQSAGLPDTNSFEGPVVEGGSPALDSYTIDLTRQAASGKIDPILGREYEIRQMIDILMRRRKNNPILTGEAGVGKTAVVEGLALRIAHGEVPPPLRGVALRTLDLGLLQAGAGVKGEFENRLKSVIQEVKASIKPVVLFIDEAHTLIGAGGQAGGSDAANLLKPALARGELRTIAATTWSEYKRYFEKDAALERRFQVVKVEEPTEALATVMMRGIAESLEKHHGVRILDEAIEASVALSSRYISGRQLPDKSVDLLDTAAARVAIGQAVPPPAIEDCRRQIEHLGTQIRILERESAASGAHTERIAENRNEQAQYAKRLRELETRWQAELKLVTEIRSIREQLEQIAGKSVESERPTAGLEDGDQRKSPEQARRSREEPGLEHELKGNGDEGGSRATDSLERAKLRTDLARLDLDLATLQGDLPLVNICVDKQAVSDVVSGWTGIPVGKMMSDDIRTVLMLAESMGERIIGQSHALDAIAQRVRTSRAGLDDPGRPVGVFLLVGPSGVGKTESAIALADILYGGERNMIVVNMSEYQEAHSVSRLKGSPPGYVGFGEGGVLTEAVRQRPYSIVLMDEVEKAHPDVLELFYQVFDKGTLEDGEGRVIDFKNTIILMTSNLGTDLLMKLCSDPETMPGPEALASELRPALREFFAPALLGRMIVVPYLPISDEMMRRIIVLKLDKVSRRLRQNHGMEFRYDESVVLEIARRCTEVESGARNIDHIVTRTLLPEISREILGRMSRQVSLGSVRVSVGVDGGFDYRLD